MSYFLRETGEYGEMGTYWFAKVLCKSRDLCGNFCKAKSPTYYAVCIYALTGFSVPSLPNTQIRLIVRRIFTSKVGKNARRGEASHSASSSSRGTALALQRHVPKRQFGFLEGGRGDTPLERERGSLMHTVQGTAPLSQRESPSSQ